MHWSYVEECSGDLVQGDILLATEELRAVLAPIHSWFADPKYLGFIVISQSCDLVRRDGSCKTPYIEIAVIRPLRPHLLTLLRSNFDWIGDRYFPSSEKNQVKNFLERVLNQNETAMGIFYLHPETTIGIAEECVALLRVSVALRAMDHYEALIAARRGRLHPEFANKLGWICGNLYSRVGIKDWNESESDRRTLTDMIGELLDEEDTRNPKFVNCSKSFQDARRKGLDLSSATAEEIERQISSNAPQPVLKNAMGAVTRALEEEEISAEAIKRICGMLESDPMFRQSLKPGKE